MQDQDRRKYFRIDHQVSLELKKVSLEEISRSTTPVQFEVSPYFSLLNDLQELESEGSHLLRRIQEKDSDIAAFLGILQRKIDTIAKTMAASSVEIEQVFTQEINLSEGGMMFSYAERLQSGQHLAVKLIFPETCIGVMVYARVCRVLSLPNGQFNIGIEFIELPENCRTLLARQVMHLQSRQRQAELLSSDEDEHLE